MSSPTIVYPRLCSYCGQLAYTWCSRCHAAWYCSQPHLNADWHRHRQFCVPYGQGTHIEGTVALVPEEQSTIIGYVFWCTEHHFLETCIYYTSMHSTDGSSSSTIRPFPHLAPFFFDESPTELILENGVHGEPVRFPLSLWYSRQAFDQRNPLNHAVSGLVRFMSHQPWYGPLVVLKYSGKRRRFFSDVCDLDLGTLSAFIMGLLK
ncbi:hypothetical protein C8Q76DRAFT_629935 [Earliella scabrosa]|nr:hypothetical protein C8Q76DRAFT_629935 [Earliella scabrosa]